MREGNGYISNTRQSCVVLVKLSRGNASDINRVAIGCAPCSRVTPIPRCSDFGASSFIVAGRWDDKRNEEEILSFFFLRIVTRIVHLIVGAVSLNA